MHAWTPAGCSCAACSSLHKAARWPEHAMHASAHARLPDSHVFRTPGRSAAINCRCHLSTAHPTQLHHDGMCVCCKVASCRSLRSCLRCVMLMCPLHAPPEVCFELSVFRKPASELQHACCALCISLLTAGWRHICTRPYVHAYGEGEEERVSKADSSSHPFCGCTLCVTQVRFLTSDCVRVGVWQAVPTGVCG